MEPKTRLYISDSEGRRFFGKGPYLLLRKIEELGSLRTAAASMNMSYTKAIGIISRAEKALGFPLTEKTTGGKGGGGSRLTEKAQNFLSAFSRCSAACEENNKNIFNECFKDFIEA